MTSTSPGGPPLPPPRGPPLQSPLPLKSFDGDIISKKKIQIELTFPLRGLHDRRVLYRHPRLTKLVLESQQIKSMTNLVPRDVLPLAGCPGCLCCHGRPVAGLDKCSRPAELSFSFPPHSIWHTGVILGIKETKQISHQEVIKH